MNEPSMARHTFNSLFVIGFTSLVFSCCVLGFATNNFLISKKPKTISIPFISGSPIPDKFFIDERMMSPVLNQGPRGTCWLFQIIGILEAQYKQQALSNGWLKDDQYLKLSEEALATKMRDICMKYPSSEPCIYSNRLDNTSTGGSLEEFYKFVQKWPEFKKSVLPSSACPYQDIDNEMNCPNLDKYISSNPLEFNIVQTFATTNIRDVKQRLVETEVPLALSIQLPVQRYLFHCENPLVSNSPACLFKEKRCPNDLNTFCTAHDFKLFKPSEVEFIFQKTGMTMPGTGHAMLLVGYNDRFVSKRVSNFSIIEAPAGGFVLKNSWGASGHTLEYLMGRISEEQDAVLCPNKDNIFRWVPASLECIRAQGRAALCSTDVKIQRGNELIRHADELICINETHCKLNDTYALLREGDTSRPSIVFDDLGVPHLKVIHYGPHVEGGAVIEVMETLPAQHAYYALQLQKGAQHEARKGSCGYVFMPYDAVEDVVRAGGLFNVEGIRVEWTKRSFVGSGKSGDYSKIKASTESFGLLRANDPFDVAL